MYHHSQRNSIIISECISLCHIFTKIEGRPWILITTGRAPSVIRLWSYENEASGSTKDIIKRITTKFVNVTQLIIPLLVQRIQVYYRPHPKDGEGNSFSLFVSSHPRGHLPWPGGTYLGWGGTYLGWGVPTLAGGTYLGWGAPILDSGDTYLGQWGYLPWTGGGQVPTLGSSCYVAGGTPLAFTQEDCLASEEI